MTDRRERGRLDSKIPEENSQVWSPSDRWQAFTHGRHEDGGDVERHGGGCHAVRRIHAGRSAIRRNPRLVRAGRITTAAGCQRRGATVTHPIADLVRRRREQRTGRHRQDGGDEQDGQCAGAGKGHDAGERSSSRASRRWGIWLKCEAIHPESADRSRLFPRGFRIFLGVRDRLAIVRLDLFRRSNGDERPIEQQVVHDLKGTRDEEGEVD